MAHDAVRENTFDSKTAVVIIGAGGYGRSVAEVVRAEGLYRLIGFLDDDPRHYCKVYGWPVLGRLADIPELLESGEIAGGIIGIGDNYTRFRVAERIKAFAPGFRFLKTVHPSAVVAVNVAIGCGTVIKAGAVVDSGASIGSHGYVSVHASVGHDAVLSNYVSLSAGVTTGGESRIGLCSHLGIGSTLFHCTSVGEHVVIGGGAVVNKDVPDCCVAYGVPAKVVRERAVGERYL